LLVAVIVSSVSLALALAMLDISYKQVTLALTGKQSQYAFAFADTALECALYWDQKQDAFRYNSPIASGIACATGAVTNYDTTGTTVIGGVTFQKRRFTIPCDGTATPSTSINATVEVYKAANAETYIYANGYNVCNQNDGRRIERGLKAHY
jgi:hypothetical protein